MTIRYAKGSIFEAKSQTIVNTVNCVGVMGKGLALEFKKRYPRMFEEYRKEYEEGKLAIGKLHLFKEYPNHWILNFPTKKHWRQKSKIEYIEAGLKTFIESYKAWGIKSIAFPQLGCQLGGLDWKDVKSVMESYLRNLPDLSVVIYSYKPRKEEQRKAKKSKGRSKLKAGTQGKNEQTKLTRFVA